MTGRCDATRAAQQALARVVPWCPGPAPAHSPVNTPRPRPAHQLRLDLRVFQHVESLITRERCGDLSIVQWAT